MALRQLPTNLPRAVDGWSRVVKRGSLHDHDTQEAPRDPIQFAKLIGDIATGQTPDVEDDGKNAAAAELGRKGGAARAARLTAEQRAAIARKGAASRWAKD